MVDDVDFLFSLSKISHLLPSQDLQSSPDVAHVSRKLYQHRGGGRDADGEAAAFFVIAFAHCSVVDVASAASTGTRRQLLTDGRFVDAGDGSCEVGEGSLWVEGCDVLRTGKESEKRRREGSGLLMSLPS